MSKKPFITVAALVALGVGGYFAVRDNAPKATVEAAVNAPPDTDGGRAKSATSAGPVVVDGSNEARVAELSPKMPRPTPPEKQAGESDDQYKLRIWVLNRWRNFIETSNLAPETQAELAVVLYDWQENLRIVASNENLLPDEDQPSIKLEAADFAAKRDEIKWESLDKVERAKQVDAEAHRRIAEILTKDQHERFRLVFMNNGVALRLASAFEKP